MIADVATARGAGRRWAKPSVVSAVRKRLAKSIASGLSVSAIAARFNVHRNTIVLWARMLEQQERLKGMLAEGLDLTTAATRLNVHSNTVRRWALLLELRTQRRCARCGRLQRGCRGHRFVEGRR